MTMPTMPTTLPKGDWTDRAMALFRERYLHTKEDGTQETPEEMCWRVASALASVEAKWGASVEDVEGIALLFYDLMVERRFFPNSPCMANAGRPEDWGKQLAACYVLPIEDSLESIYDTLKRAALIHSSGGGTGFDFSALREEDCPTRGASASGPVSFMRVYNASTQEIKQAGQRRGANMGVLRCDHPDLMKFITCKMPSESNQNPITNFNISVGITDAFCEAVRNDDLWALVSPKTGRMTHTVQASDVWHRIVECAWATGDPGLLFLDRANRSASNPIPDLVQIAATNPCGEEFLEPNGICNLGSINLGQCVGQDEHGKPYVLWSKLQATVRLAVRLLDNMIELNPVQDEAVRKQNFAVRRMGLGVMGWADMLVRLSIPYASQQARDLAQEIAIVMADTALIKSQELAETRGCFPLQPQSRYKKDPPRRNGCLTDVAPTGTISFFADCSPGIEPLMGLSYIHNNNLGRKMTVRNRDLERVLAGRRDLDGVAEQILQEANEKGLIGRLRNLAPDLADLFVTAHEVNFKDHILMQAAWQAGVNNSISKCLAAGTLMGTSDGLYRIEQFSDVDLPDTFIPLDGTLQTSSGDVITQHYYAGEKPAVTIRLDNGSELTGAVGTHRVKTTSGWKIMSDLKLGDRVIGAFTVSHGRGGRPLPPLGELRTNAVDVHVPTEMSVDLALFFGMIAADGTLTESTGAIEITKCDVTVLNEFDRLGQILFGLSSRLSTDKRNDVTSRVMHSRPLMRWIVLLIGKGAYDKHTPAQILMGSAEEKLAFLTGVSLDGYYIPNRGSCVYEGMSKGLAYEIAEMCRSFGMPLVRQQRKFVEYSQSYAYGVVVSNQLQTVVLPFQAYKRGEVHYASYMVEMDREPIEALQLKCNDPQYSNVQSLKQRKHVTYCRSIVAKELGLPTNVPVFTVVAIEDAGVLPLYDVEVDRSHQYVVNGVISHNTVNMHHDATVEDVGRAYQMAMDIETIKGFTIYRNGCKATGQVINLGADGDADGDGTITDAELSVIAGRPRKLPGEVYQIVTPVGKGYVTITHDADRQPLEVFTTVGKAGSDIQSFSESLGRVASICLRMPSTLSRADRLAALEEQMRGIGGASSVGLGPARVRSVPDAIAGALREWLEQTSESGGVSLNGKTATDLCPKCHNASFHAAEGCRTCTSCGYTYC